MGNYKKLLAAVVGGLLQVGVLVAPTVPDNWQPALTAVIAVLTAISVYGLKNVPPQKQTP